MIRLFDALRENAITLADLHKLCFPDPWDPQAIARLSGGPGFTLIDGSLSRPRGFVLARVAAEEAEILTIAVDPAERRTGVGTSLLREAARVAQARGAQMLFLEVSTVNIAALALYASLGFAKAGSRKGYYRVPGVEPADALVLKATLPLAGHHD